MHVWPVSPGKAGIQEPWALKRIRHYRVERRADLSRHGALAPNEWSQVYCLQFRLHSDKTFWKRYSKSFAQKKCPIIFVRFAGQGNDIYYIIGMRRSRQILIGQYALE